MNKGFCRQEVYTRFCTANVSVAVRYKIACDLHNCCLSYSAGGEVAASARRPSRHYPPYSVSQTFFADTQYAALLMA